MTNTVLYASSKVLDKITKIAAQKHSCNFDDVGLVAPATRQVGGDGEEQKTEIYFYVFDHALNKIGTVTRSEVRNYANGESDN